MNEARSPLAAVSALYRRRLQYSSEALCWYLFICAYFLTKQSKGMLVKHKISESQRLKVGVRLQFKMSHEVCLQKRKVQSGRLLLVLRKCRGDFNESRAEEMKDDIDVGSNSSISLFGCFSIIQKRTVLT